MAQEPEDTRGDESIPRRPLPDEAGHDLPAPRRRPLPTQLPADASPAQISQSERDAVSAADPSQMTEFERNALETDHAVRRRLAEEGQAEEHTALAGEAQAQQMAVQEEYEANLAAYHERQAARAAATPEDALETPEGSVRVTVTQDFTLVHDDGTSVTYTTTGTNCGIPGTWDMPQEDAEHWYTQHYTDSPPPPEPPAPGTAAAAAVAQRQASRRMLVEAALDQEEQQALDAVRLKRQERLKAALGEAYEPTPTLVEGPSPTPRP